MDGNRRHRQNGSGLPSKYWPRAETLLAIWQTASGKTAVRQPDDQAIGSLPYFRNRSLIASVKSASIPP